MKQPLQKLLANQHYLSKQFIKSSSQESWSIRLNPDTWSAYEHLAHIVCYQHVFYERMLRLSETNHLTFEAYDGTSDENFTLYKTYTLKELWQDFKKTRKKLCKLLYKLSPEVENHVATHSRYGTLSMEQWTTFFILHESHHLFASFKLLQQGNSVADQPEKLSLLEPIPEEYLEVYTSTNQPTGQSFPRSEVHRKGLWHKTMHCWIIYRNKKGKDFVVFQRRSAWKDSDPNKFDTTAAGHYTAAIPIEQQRFREIEEELGLKPIPTEIVYAGLRVNVEDSQAEFQNHEFQDVYFWKNATPLKDYVLQTDEVSGLLAVEITQGLKLFTNELPKITGKGLEVIYAEDGTTSYQPKTFTVTQNDFGHTLDNYFAKALLTAQRILAGEKYVII